LKNNPENLRCVVLWSSNALAHRPDASSCQQHRLVDNDRHVNDLDCCVPLCMETRRKRVASMCMRPDGRRDGGPCGHSRRKRALKTSIRCTSRKRGLLPLACTFATLLLFVGCEIHARRIITAFSYSNPKRMSMQFAHESVLPPLPRIETPSTADTESAVLSDESNPGLSVLYTNDPKMVSRWLSDHVATGGCTLGFDLEVSCRNCV